MAATPLQTGQRLLDDRQRWLPAASRRSSRRSTRRSTPTSSPAMADLSQGHGRCSRSTTPAYKDAAGDAARDPRPDRRRPEARGQRRPRARTWRANPSPSTTRPPARSCSTTTRWAPCRSPARPARRRAPPATRGTTRRPSPRSALDRRQPYTVDRLPGEEPASAPRPRRPSSSACSPALAGKTRDGSGAAQRSARPSTRLLPAAAHAAGRHVVHASGRRRPGLTPWHSACCQRKPDSGLGNIRASPGSPSRNIDWVLLLAQGGARRSSGCSSIYSASYTKFAEPVPLRHPPGDLPDRRRDLDDRRHVVRLRLVARAGPVPLRRRRSCCSCW